MNITLILSSLWSITLTIHYTLFRCYAVLNYQKRRITEPKFRTKVVNVKHTETRSINYRLRIKGIVHYFY